MAPQAKGDGFRLPASFVSKVEAGERWVGVVELQARCQLYGVGLIAFLKKAGFGGKG